MEFYKVTLTFESVDEILWSDHSNISSLPVLTNGAICLWNLEIWSKFFFWLNLAFRVISFKRLLVISMLFKTAWWQEFRKWSHKINLLDTSTTSPHYFHGKRIRTTNKNLTVDIRFLKFNQASEYWPFSLPYLLFPLPRWMWLKEKKMCWLTPCYNILTETLKADSTQGLCHSDLYEIETCIT